MTDSAADPLAERVITGYRDYQRHFLEITRRAWQRFERREWEDAQDDARERILLYDVVVHRTLRSIRQQLRGARPPAAAAARAARAAFAEWAEGRPDVEVAETFYNSVIRRLYGTVGVDPGIEFIADAVDEPRSAGSQPWREIGLGDGFAHAIDAILDSLPFRAPWHERDDRVAAADRLLAAEIGHAGQWDHARLEVLRPVFFRNKAAYVVGRIVGQDRTVPLVLALAHTRDGIVLDAVLPTSDEASVVFGFTRSYLHADMGAPRPTIDFLHSIMPLKRLDELYTALGFNRHGKTEFYRTLREHLRSPDATFEPTPGKKGLVMIVFTIPSLNVVFKVIRDRFGHPKRTTRERVMKNYDLVFVGDRVGRLADAQPFERLELPCHRFSDAVLRELTDSAATSVSMTDDTVTIEHLYAERRVHPLDMYLEEVGADEARRAIVDFGQAIKDMAAADIFPGDMLVKNFGVTRHGRVIFYDYDEIALLSACNFRSIPRSPYPEAELADEPQYYVGPDDVFPAEWRAFLGPTEPLRQALESAHPEIFDHAWWREMQDRQRAGELVDFYPYDAERRLG